VLALDGRPGPWLPDGFDVIAQRGDGLDRRLTAAFADCFAAMPGEPVVLVGMDTPQLTGALLAQAGARLDGGEHDAVLGPALDGGYWLLGLRRLHPAAIEGVAMSADDTFDQQLGRLDSLGYRTALVEPLHDVDHAADAQAVAALVPGTRFARAVEAALGEPVPA
jgi:glycosyltransferase A (GT-A) superfamily protein (DUF2064 family)